MTRPERSRVRHGMATCARYGCQRPECKRAYATARARNALDRSRGLTGFVQADEAVHHVNKLIRAGMSIGDITQKSGLSRDRVSAIARSTPTRITRTTHEALLGIPVPRTPVQPQLAGKIDAIGAQRRLRARATLGWSRTDLAARTGISNRALGAIRGGAKARILIHHHQVIERVYEQLWNQRPEDHGCSVHGAAWLREFAKAQGWKRPADLDDDDIDWRTPAAGRAA